MSLEILLEAAKYLEYNSEPQARVETPPEVVAFTSKRKSHTSANKPASSSNSSSSFHNHHSKTHHHHSRSDQEFFAQQSYASQDGQRDKRRSGGSDITAGTREVHNKLEKNRRAHLKECFEMLKKQLPTMDERKTSNLSILRGALRYIQVLKRKEREYEHEMEKLAREKIASQQKLASLKKGLTSQVDHIDVSRYLPEQDNETTTTASECGALSDPEDDPIGPVRQIAQLGRIPSLNHSLLQAHHQPHRASAASSSQQFGRPVSPDSASQSSSTSSASSDGGDGLATVSQQRQLTFNPGNGSSSIAVTDTSSVAPTLSRVITPPQRSPISSKSVSGAIEVPTSEATVSSPFKKAMVPRIVKETTLSSTPQAINLPFQSSALPATHIHFAGSGGTTSTTNHLQLGGMTGVLTASPHTVQVINQGTGVKVIATSPGAIGNGSALFSAASPNGPLRIFSPANNSSQLVAMTGPNTTLAMVNPNTVGKIGQQSLVRFATQSNPANRNKNAVGAPVTLVTSSAMVNVSQLNNAGKSVIFNQGLSTDQAGCIVASGSQKGATVTLTANPKGQHYATVTGSNGLTYVQPKVTSHLLQAVSQKALSQTLANAGVGQSGMASLGRQLITTAIKPGNNQLSRVTQVTQLVTQPTIGQIVTSGSHGNALMGTPITMVPASAVNQQHLNKVLANTAVLKTVPILQQQLQLQTPGTGSTSVSNNTVPAGMKPLVMVSLPNVVGSSSSAPTQQGPMNTLTMKQ